MKTNILDLIMFHYFKCVVKGSLRVLFQVHFVFLYKPVRAEYRPLVDTAAHCSWFCLKSHDLSFSNQLIYFPSPDREITCLNFTSDFTFCKMIQKQEVN